jgi:hypothetical protein
MRRRILPISLVVVLMAIGIPALAAVLAPREAQPAQLSINVNSPVFTVTNLVPGDATVRCIRIRNEGDSPVSVAGTFAVRGTLAPYLVATVAKGTGLGDNGPSCQGFAASGTYGFGTTANGVPVSALKPDAEPSLAPHTERSYLFVLTVPNSANPAAMGKVATVHVDWAATTIDSGSGGGSTGGGSNAGGVASGTTGGLDANGNFISNSKVKKLFRVGKARLLRNGDVTVGMYLPAGGAVRAKVIIAGNVYYAHRLYKRVLPGKLKVVLHRRPVGRIAVSGAKHKHRKLSSLVTTRYRWAHGPNAFVQPQQKLTLVRG